jgi:hypothetical protein
MRICRCACRRLPSRHHPPCLPCRLHQALPATLQHTGATPTVPGLPDARDTPNKMYHLVHRRLSKAIGQARVTSGHCASHRHANLHPSTQVQQGRAAAGRVRKLERACGHACACMRASRRRRAQRCGSPVGKRACLTGQYAADGAAHVAVIKTHLPHMFSAEKPHHASRKARSISEARSRGSYLAPKSHGRTAWRSRARPGGAAARRGERSGVPHARTHPAAATPPARPVGPRQPHAAPSKAVGPWQARRRPCRGQRAANGSGSDSGGGSGSGSGSGRRTQRRSRALVATPRARNPRRPPTPAAHVGTDSS